MHETQIYRTVEFTTEDGLHVTVNLGINDATGQAGYAAESILRLIEDYIEDQNEIAEAIETIGESWDVETTPVVDEDEDEDLTAPLYSDYEY